MDQMSFADKPLAALTAEDLQAIIGLPEGLALEFKRELPIAEPDEKRELANDWSGMANADGGRLIYGIQEQELTDGSRVAASMRGSGLAQGVLRAGGRARSLALGPRTTCSASDGSGQWSAVGCASHEDPVVAREEFPVVLLLVEDRQELRVQFQRHHLRLPW